MTTQTQTKADHRKSEWWEWIKKNPEVFQMFENIALEMIEKGAKHGSSDDILHEIRKKIKTLNKDTSGYKINNNYSAYFSRYFTKLYPEHSSFFEMRRSKADSITIKSDQQSVKTYTSNNKYHWIK